MSPRYNYEWSPRPTAKVYQLRKQGEIDQAYQCALDLYQANPDDEDILKAYAWTLIDLCKREYDAGNRNVAESWLLEACKINVHRYQDNFARNIQNQIHNLKIKLDPHTETIRQASELSKAGKNNEAYIMLTTLYRKGELSVESHLTYGWILYRYLKENSDSLTSLQVRTTLRDYLKLNNHRPSQLHSMILNFAFNYSRRDREFKLIPFFKLWGSNNLTIDDFTDSTDRDGKRIPSMMSRFAREIVRYNHYDIAEFLNDIPDWKNRFVELLRESYFWIIFNSVNENRLNDAWEHFSIYNGLYAQYGPSEYHSKILALAERQMKDENQYRFLKFFSDWGPVNLREQDWQEEMGNNGDTYKPLAMKCIKKAFDSLNSRDSIAEVDFAWLVDLYKVAVRKFPYDEWTVRSLAILYYRGGNLADSEKIYKNLVLKLGDKYYIWNEFAACVQDVNVKVGMLCKAISLERNEDYIGKIRLDLAELLIAVDKRTAATVEINLHKEHYASKGWGIKPKVAELESLCGNVEGLPADNRALYDEYIPYAEEFAYADIPETQLILIDAWKSDNGKKYQKFVDGNNLELVINIRKFPVLKNARQGQVWAFKFHYDQSNDRYLPLITKRSDQEDWSILPECWGYINHVNIEKKVYCIYTQSSDFVSEKYTEQSLSKGDFVCFRQYRHTVIGEKKINIYLLKKVAKEDAVKHFLTSVVLVVGVNVEKRLFHFIQSNSAPSGVIHYDQTSLRPEVGDFLRIYYYIREKRDVRRPGENHRIAEVIDVETTTEINSNLVQEGSGTLRVKYHRESTNDAPPDFAFIGDKFVPKTLLRHYGITHDCEVRYRALRDKNNKWKVFCLEVL